MYVAVRRIDILIMEVKRLICVTFRCFSIKVPQEGNIHLVQQTLSVLMMIIVMQGVYHQRGLTAPKDHEITIGHWNLAT